MKEGDENEMKKSPRMHSRVAKEPEEHRVSFTPAYFVVLVLEKSIIYWKRKVRVIASTKLFVNHNNTVHVWLLIISQGVLMMI